MPNSAQPQLSPLQAEENLQTRSIPVGQPHDFLTFGLHTGWRPAWEWATAQGIQTDLLQVIDTALIREKFNTFGSILRFLSSDHSYRLLESWRHIDEAPALLWRVAQAIIHASDILQQYPRLPVETSAANQLMGETRSHYLLGTLLERLPAGSTEAGSWIQTLRLWLLTHAINRSFQGNVQDKHLREVSSRLRIGCDTNADWLQPFFAVHSVAIEFDVLNRHLSHQCKQLLEGDEHPWDRKIKARSLLHALVEVAQRHHHVESATEFPLQPLWCSRGLYSLPHEAMRVTSATGSLFADEEIDSEAQRVQSEDGLSDLAEVKIDGKLSWTHQRLYAHSVLLLSSEEIQFLPWSWSHPNPIEAKHLSSWVFTLLHHPEPCERTLGALVWTALHTGRSLRRVLDIGIGSPVVADWCWDPHSRALRRIPPMRQPGWQPKSPEEAAWVTPMAEALAIALHPKVEDALDRRLARDPGAQSLGTLWDANWGCSPEQKFREMTSHGPLARLTPGILSGTLPQRVFKDSGDAALARLVSSHPLSGLPGPCAYANWPATQMAGIWPPTNPVAMASRPNQNDHEINGLGSRLDPIESLLANSIANATRQFRKLRREGSVIAFHNALTAYLAVALLAATGSRPVKDLFESPCHFDLTEGFVFIDDKASSELRQGRLVPLPRGLCRYLGSRYPAHLQKLANALRPAHPELADEILDLALGHPTGALPYLFLLNDDPKLSWSSVSESTLKASGLFDWPLPYNLFRHRLARLLRQQGIDPEIIDSLLGHAETGCATHGDYSCRIWADDMHSARGALETSFQALRFVPISSPRSGFPPLRPAKPGTTPSVLNRPFGIEARRQVREEHEQAALEDARLLIEEFLAGRQLGDLDGDQIHDLSKRLLFNPNGLPSSIGGLRYRYLNERLEAIWQEQGKRPRLKKRFLPIEAETSPFTEDAPGALGIYRQLCTLFNKALECAPPSRTNFSEASAIAAVALCLENRITSPTLLEGVLKGMHFRLVTFKQKVYFEYLPQTGGNKATVATRRHRVSYRTAAFLDRALAGKPKNSGTLPSILEPLAALLKQSTRLATATIDTLPFLTNVSSLVDQVNAMILPGVLAGYMAGRVQSYPLTWRDWLRIAHGTQVRIPTQSSGPDEPGSFEAAACDKTLPGGVALPPTNQGELDALQIAAQKCFTALGNHLKNFQGDLSSKVAMSRRRDLVRELEKELRKWSGKVSTAVLALGQWMTTLVMRSKNRRTLNALTSTERYFAALAPAFKEIAYNVDLMALDEEDVTLFYGDLLESRRSVQDYGYVCNRLIDFHRWASQHGVEDPDWSELPMEAAGHRVSPGFIAEVEYQDALLLLTRTINSDGDQHWLSAFLLLCCYRFGLRSSEALGLIRTDWIEQDGQVVVLVRSNRVRQLKTVASRRQVPLLFALSDLERTIIRHVIMRAEACHGDNIDALLFSANDNQSISTPGPLKKDVISALKAVTGNTEIILHHARHTAANRVAVGLISPPLEDAWLAGAIDGETGIDLTLLGRPGVSRRTTWGSARFLGHAGPSTTLSSYLHFLGDWSDALLGTGQAKACRYTLTHTINLDAFPTQAPLDTGLLAQLETPFAAPSPGRLLKFIRLLGRGKSAQDAGAALDLPPRLAERLEAALYNIGRNFALAPSQADPRTDNSTSLGFLRRIKESAWTRLLKQDVLTEPSSAPATSIAPSPTLDSWVRMVGPKRHLILWKPEHFAWASERLRELAIDPSRYRCIHSAHADGQHLELARKFGFEPISPQEAKRGSSPQHPDRAYEGTDDEFEVRKRCALVFEENSDFPIRNSIEFVLVLLAFAGTDQ